MRSSSMLAALALLSILLITACDSGSNDDNNPQQPPPGNDSTDPPAAAADYRLSGTVIAASGSVADVDTNDPQAPQADNDDFTTAQSLPNPVTVGGHLNRPGQGELGGATFRTGDTADFYSVMLHPGDVVFLTMANDPTQATFFNRADLDIHLYDQNGQALDNSQSYRSRTEIIEIDANKAGQRFIEVFAYGGASNYTLSIGRAPQTIAAPTNMRLSADFVPGEIIVCYQDNSTTVHTASRLQALGLTQSGNATGPLQLVKLGDPEQRRAAFNALGHAPSPSSTKPFGDPELALKNDTLRMIKLLATRADVRYAEPNMRRYSLFQPNDEFFERQWHYPLIQLPRAWDITRGDAAVTVAVIDTGILPNHPDIAANLDMTDGYDFIADPRVAGDGDGRDGDATDPGDRAQIGASSFHGSHVAGIIAASMNNSIGGTGIAPQTRLLPLRALGRGGEGSDFDLAAAIRYAAQLNNASGRLPEQQADIINLSLGGEGITQTLREAVADAAAAGVILVAAAGNSSSDDLIYPAALDDVLAISAVDSDSQLAPYSNFGDWIDLAAPGGNMQRDADGDGFKDGVLSSSGDDSGFASTVDYVYEFQEGTSMAVPHVSGVLALMAAAAQAAGTPFGPAQVAALLREGRMTSDLGPAGKDTSYGYGLINAHQAVLAIQNDTIQFPVLDASPSAINLGTVANQATITLRNIGAAAPEFTVTATSNTEWLAVNAAETDSNGLGAYRLTANRAQLVGNGTFSARVDFTANSEDSVGTTVTVSLQQMTTDPEANLGYTYVLLIDNASGVTVKQDQGHLQNGSLEFKFTDIAAGTYQLLAGTDANNNGFICDAGESCGGYRTLSRLDPISVQSDLNALDFTARFGVELTGLTNRTAQAKRHPEASNDTTTDIKKYE